MSKKYFSYYPDDGISFHDTIEDAERRALAGIEYYRQNGEPWDDSVEKVCYGEVFRSEREVNDSYSKIEGGYFAHFTGRFYNRGNLTFFNSAKEAHNKIVNEYLGSNPLTPQQNLCCGRIIKKAESHDIPAETPLCGKEGACCVGCEEGEYDKDMCTDYDPRCDGEQYIDYKLVDVPAAQRENT